MFMIKSYGFLFLEYDVDYNKNKFGISLSFDDEQNQWVPENKSLSNDIFCHSLRAAKAHLRRHNEIPKGTRFKLVSRFYNFDIYLTKS